MLHSILILDPNPENRLTILKNLVKDPLTLNPDLLILEPDPSISIKEVRAIQSFLLRKSYKKDKKIVVITDAGTLTLPAQHALLKVLEEPPPNSIVALLTESTNQLLPTIISRCQLIKSRPSSTFNSTSTTEQKQLFESISQASLGERVNLAAPHSSDKKSALLLVKNQLLYLKSNPKKHFPLINNILLAQKKLNANVNPKLTLENLFLSYQKA